VDGGVFHLTHRCHNRAFLLKFACNRDTYRAMLREHLGQLDLSVLDYCITLDRLCWCLRAGSLEEVSFSFILTPTTGPPVVCQKEKGEEDDLRRPFSTRTRTRFGFFLRALRVSVVNRQAALLTVQALGLARGLLRRALIRVIRLLCG